MIEITVVCDKCGARRTFDPSLTSDYYRSEDGFGMCSCNPPREVSILESVRENVMDGPRRWRFLMMRGGDVLICSECWDKYLCAMKEFDEEIDRCNELKREAEAAYGKAATKWVTGHD